MTVLRMIMQNLPEDQSPRDLDVTVSNVFHDLKCIGRDMELKDIFAAFKELNNNQDLVIFSNGKVVATRKGLCKYG